MHLREILIYRYRFADPELFDSKYDGTGIHPGTIFNRKLYVIGDYLTTQVRKLKFETDDFKAIHILCGTPENYVEQFQNFMDIGAKFDFVKFNQLSRRDRCIYAIDVLKDALYRLSKIKTIPYEQICKICDDLVEADFVFSWKFCGLRLPEHRLKVRFESVLTTSDYKINIIVHRYGDKTPLCQGQVIRTAPSDIAISLVSRKVQVEDDRLALCSSNRPMIYLNISDLSKGIIRPHFAGLPYPMDEDAAETFRHLQKMLAYDGHHYD